MNFRNRIIRYISYVTLSLATVLAPQNSYSSIACQDYARELSIIDKKIELDKIRLEKLRKLGNDLELKVVENILEEDKKKKKRD